MFEPAANFNAKTSVGPYKLELEVASQFANCVAVSTPVINSLVFCAFSFLFWTRLVSANLRTPL